MVSQSHIHSEYLGRPAGVFLILLRYNYTSSLHLVNRLTSRNLHLLALRISTYLSLKPDAVLKHWACVKITKSKPSATGAGRDAELQGDDEVCQSIVEKFSKLGGGSVSYADIARKAWEVGRLDLATKVHQGSVLPVPLCFDMCWISLVVRPRTARVRSSALTPEYEGRQTRID